MRPDSIISQIPDASRAMFNRCIRNKKELLVPKSLNPPVLIHTSRLVLRGGLMLSRQAPAVPVGIRLAWPLHYSFCKVLISLLLVAAVVRLEPSFAWTRSLVSSWVAALSWVLSENTCVLMQMAPDYDHLTLMQKVEVFEHAVNNTAGDDLAKLLWLKSPSSEVWNTGLFVHSLPFGTPLLSGWRAPWLLLTCGAHLCHN